MTLSSIAQTTMSRRHFLKAVGATAGYMFLPLDFGRFPAAPQKAAPIAIPPSLMLHSPDGRADFLPYLLEQLQADGFTAVTYQSWYRSVLEGQAPAKPIILSIDDISLARSACAAFNTFGQMKEWIKAAGMTAVYGVITEPVIGTEPQRDQDETRWDLMQAWAEEGFELASHTTYHSNFNAVDTGPRPDFTAADYEAEIVRSAHLMETKLGERGLAYVVQTLILPYGSGYSYQQPEPQIHPGIAAACQQTNIKFVVGIAHGRIPQPRTTFTNPNELVYVGRIPPAYLTDANGQQIPDAGQTAVWLRAWHHNNQYRG
ncbi:MAG: polysaccharide deacetylase family protein [Anaerolineae bacterium]|nr:polysaccharide deacetylase family protein [Anaerolineae bacterium]